VNADREEGPTELDSHADTCVLGFGWQVMEESGESCIVRPYSGESGESTEMRVVNAATAYDHPTNGEVYILQVQQGLYAGEAQTPSLLCPNQLRYNGIQVDDVPRQFNPRSTHSIYFPREEVSIPLKLNGVMSCFVTRYPTREELRDCTWLQMTSSERWDPNTANLAKREEAFIAREDDPILDDDIQNIRDRPSRNLMSISLDDRSLGGVSSCLSPGDFLQDLLNTVRVSNAASTERYVSAIASYHPETFDVEYRTRGRMQMASYDPTESKISAVASKTRHVELSPAQLAKMWHVGVDVAASTLKSTTQDGIRTAVRPISRRYRTEQQQFKYNRLNSQFYSDTFKATVPSIGGNIYGQIFVNDIGFVKVVPMKKKSEASIALNTFFMDVGVMNDLHTDGAKEMQSKDWDKVLNKFGGVKQSVVEPYSPWQNRAEGEIREVKRQVARIMAATNASKRLWDYCVEYACELRCRTARPLWKLKGRTPYEVVTGDTPDISEWLEFGWYDPVFYRNPGAFPANEPAQVGRWLGVAHRVGQALCYWILPISGIPIARSTVQSWSTEDLDNDVMREKLKAYDEAIKAKLKTEDIIPGVLDVNQLREWDIDGEEEVDEKEDPEGEMPEADDWTADAFDQYINAEVMLPRGDTLQRAQVKSRKRNADGDPVGTANSNPILDSRVYMVEHPDGAISEFTANVIAENLYSQVDSEGNEYLILSEIIDHRKSHDAVARDDGFLDAEKRQPKRTTKGWDLLIEWKDGTTSWEALKDLKESNPVQVAEYAVLNELVAEPAFCWWIKDVLRRRDRIISKIKTRYHKRTHKFGIELPKSVKEALEIDKKTNTDYWRRAIEKEMKNVRPAFNILPAGARRPVARQEIRCHMIFDVKLGDLTRKARLVAGGHMTDPPASMTYSSVVSRESVRIAFLIAALNGLDVLSADIGNAYLNAECREMIFTVCGLEFGEEAGRFAEIVRALYGLKSSGAAWHSHLAETMSALGYKSCKADADVWFRPATKDCGHKYYEYVLVFVDDILCVSHRAKKVMESLAALYRLKEDNKGNKYAEPERYLGSNIGKYYFDKDNTDDKPRWYMSSDDYVKGAISNVETELDKVDRKLKNAKHSTSVLPHGYRPELDVSPELDDEQANYYQELVGVLRWAVELGRIDIHTSVSMMSQHLALPRQGHLDNLFHIFAYLKCHERSKVVFDETRVSWDENKFENVDWREFYDEAEELMPPNAPEPRGEPIQINCFVDADHAGNQVTRRSHSGILIYLNSAPIDWYSKRQNTVESSTFGSEFIALRIATEKIQALRIKLRMMGIPIEGPANVFCDNQSVVTSSTKPESTLKKKHVAICYHKVRESCASKMIRIAHEPGETNLADVLTKILPGPRLKKLIGHILY
jgi:hypothetical protein